MLQHTELSTASELMRSSNGSPMYKERDLLVYNPGAFLKCLHVHYHWFVRRPVQKKRDIQCIAGVSLMNSCALTPARTHALTPPPPPTHTATLTHPLHEQTHGVHRKCADIACSPESSHFG